MLHAGTRRRDDGSVVSAGGRVLSVVATGADLAAAREDAYRRLSRIRLRGSHYRTDIARPPPSEGRLAGGRRTPERCESRTGAGLAPGRHQACRRGSRRERTARPDEAARAAIPPFYVMRVLAAAASGSAPGDLFNLAAGQPSTPAPRPVRAGGRRRAGQRILGYTETRPARCGRRSPAHYGRRYGLDVDPDEVVVTTGIVGRLPARVPRRVRRRRPGRDGPARLPGYRNILTALGCEVVDCRAGRRPGYQPTVAMLDELDGSTAWSWPARPTRPAPCSTPAELAALAAHCAAHGVRLITDEIYHGITYAGAPATSLRVGDLARGGRGQLVLQVLLDDGLADGLAAGPASGCAGGGRAGRQLGDLPAGARPARGAGRVTRGLRRVRRARRPVRGEPGAAARRPAPARASTGSPRPTARSTSTPTSRI